MYTESALLLEIIAAEINCDSLFSDVYYQIIFLAM